MKILIIKSSLSSGGVDNLVMNQIPFLYNHGWDIYIQFFDGCEEDHLDFYSKFNCHLLCVPSLKKGIKNFIKAEEKIFRENTFDIIHSHICHLSYFVLKAAENVKLKTPIVIHTHYDNYYKGWPYLRFFMPIIQREFRVSKYTLIASSQKSGVALFGKKSKFSLIYNGIDTKKFSFNKQIREDLRKQLKIKQNTLCVCTIGMLRSQKNPLFLLSVFKLIKKSIPDSQLFFIGDGPMNKEVNLKATKLGILSSIHITGIRSDVNYLLSAMDLCIFPSKYEGFSMRLLETQCNGLPCLCSDKAPKEIKQTCNFAFDSLKNGPCEWCDRSLALLRSSNHKDFSNQILSNGLDQSNFNEKTLTLYEKLLSQNNKH